MIDRSTFRTVMALVAIMLAAAAWRVSMLSDWTRLPRYGADGVALPPGNSAALLISPGLIVFFLIVMAVGRRMSTASDRDRAPWRKWARLNLIGFVAICAAQQAYIIARSLGLMTALSPALYARTLFVVSGLLLLVIGNVMPKLPWLGSRIWFFNLDRDQGAQLQRLRGWLVVALGLFVTLGGLFLPLKIVPPLLFSLWTAAAIVLLLFCATAKRGQPQ